MNKIWKLRKVFAFMLALTAFVYVGYINSQKGRYQLSGDGVTRIDTQTGDVDFFYGDVFNKLNFKKGTNTITKSKTNYKP